MIILLSMIVYQICMALAGLSLTELIFELFQVPMQNLSDTLAGGIVIVLLISLLFWAGLHGPNIVMGVMAPIDVYKRQGCAVPQNAYLSGHERRGVVLSGLADTGRRWALPYLSFHFTGKCVSG